jgi:hypothetical protein
LQRRKTKKKKLQGNNPKQRSKTENFSVKPIRPKHSQKHYKPKSQKKQEITKKKNERQQKQQHGQQHLVLTQIAIPKENPNNINPLKFIPNPFGQSIPKSNINQIHIHTAEPT